MKPSLRERRTIDTEDGNPRGAAVRTRSGEKIRKGGERPGNSLEIFFVLHAGTTYYIGRWRG